MCQPDALVVFRAKVKLGAIITLVRAYTVCGDTKLVIGWLNMHINNSWQTILSCSIIIEQSEQSLQLLEQKMVDGESL